MTKHSKKTKGFTIVELVIVIGVIGVLSAVLIPTFVNVSKKAQSASDASLVGNLNTGLKMDVETKHHTMYQALSTVKKNAGIDETNIKASVANSQILWDSYNDVFCYLDAETDKVTYSYNVDTKLEKDDSRLWKIYSKNETVPAYDSQTYSIYLGRGATAPTKVKTGFDIGENTSGDLEYNNQSTSKTYSTIRTNGGNLTIDAPNGTVYHYQDVDNLTITSVFKDSYHEYGKANAATITNGHFVAEAGSTISSFTSTGTKDNVKLTDKGGRITQINGTNGIDYSLYDSAGNLIEPEESQPDIKPLPAEPADLGSFVFDQENENINAYRTNAIYNGEYTESVALSYRGSPFNEPYQQGTGLVFDFANLCVHESDSNNQTALTDTNNNFSNITKMILKQGETIIEEKDVLNNAVTIYNLVPGADYRIEFTDGDNLIGFCNVSATGQVRQIKLPENSVLNMRDLGGWPTLGGGMIKYGKIYRSATLGSVTDSDKNYLKNVIGIEEEIELRGSEEIEKSDDLVKHNPLELAHCFNLEKASSHQYKNALEYNANDKSYRTKRFLQEIFSSVEANRPVIFHCHAGADRTGTIAFLIEALLGVEENYLAQDYEITTLCHSNQTLVDRTSNDNNVYSTMVSYLKENYAGNTIQEKAFNWCLQNGFTSSELNEFISAMTTSETPAQYVGVTYQLSHVASNNSVTLSRIGESYSAVLTPDDDYHLTSVSVSMGGTNVTSTVYSEETRKINIPNVSGELVIASTAEKNAAAYTNLISTSQVQAQDSNAVYNGKGYKEGVYLTGDGDHFMKEAAETHASGKNCTTGFIPLDFSEIKLKYIYIKTKGDLTDSHTRIVFYRADKTTRVVCWEFSQLSSNGASYERLSGPDSDGYSIYKITNNNMQGHGLVPTNPEAAAKYVRFCIYGEDGKDFIITFDQEIS